MAAGDTARAARWRVTAYAVWASIGILVLLAVAGWVFGRVWPAFIPFLIGFLLLFLLNGPVSALARRGLTRARATLIVFGLSALALIAFGVIFAPVIAEQIREFAVLVVRYRGDVLDLVTALQSGRGVPGALGGVFGGGVPAWVVNLVTQVSTQITSVFTTVAAGAANIVVATGSGVATGFFDFFLGLVISFWLLKDIGTIREELRVLVGPRFRADLDHLVDTVGRVVGGYIKGQTIASALTGAGAAIGLAILGVPSALVLGIITFFFNYVPYIGPFLSGLIAGVLALFGNNFGLPPLVAALLAIGIVVLVQNLVDTLVTPRVMSEQVNLHPTLVIFALLVGGTLFGFFGMVLAIPVAATGKGLFVYYWENRSGRSLETEDGALFRSAAPCDPDDECAESTGEEPASENEKEPVS